MTELPSATPFKPAKTGAFLTLSLLFLGAIGFSNSARAQSGQPKNLGQKQALIAAETSSGNFLAGLAASSARDPEAAAYYFREASRDDRRNKELLERAFIASVQDGSLNDAFGLAQRVLQRNPENSLAHLVLGVRALKKRQFVRARNSFQRSGGTGRNADVSAALLVAWSQVGRGQIKQALATVDRFTDPRLAIYRNFYGGMMADVAGNRREAAKRLKAAYEADPSVIRVADVYARFEARHGSADVAKAIYAKLDERPGNQPFFAAAKKLVDAGEVPEPLVQNVLQGASEVLYTSAEIGTRGTETIALIYLQLANFLHGENDNVLVALAENFEQLKQSDRAIELYSRVPETSGIKTRTVIRSAFVLNEVKRLPEALKLLEDKISTMPQELTLHDTVSSLNRANKQWPQAIEASSKAIALADRNDKTSWNLFYGRGIAYERNKQWPLAEADLKQALSLLPEEPRTEGERVSRALVLNHLAYSWVDMGVHIDEAFVMLKRAVALQPQDGYIVDSLGWAYYRLGQYDNAVLQLERAVELKPEDPVLNDHLGDAYWKAGRTNEARFQWNHARDLNPEPEDLEKILKKIDKGMDEPKAAETEAPKKPDGG